jgi:hypothetical protein
MNINPKPPNIAPTLIKGLGDLYVKYVTVDAASITQAVTINLFTVGDIALTSPYDN